MRSANLRDWFRTYLWITLSITSLVYYRYTNLGFKIWYVFILHGLLFTCSYIATLFEIIYLKTFFYHFFTKIRFKWFVWKLRCFLNIALKIGAEHRFLYSWKDVKILNKVFEDQQRVWIVSKKTYFRIFLYSSKLKDKHIIDSYTNKRFHPIKFLIIF